MGAQAFFLAFVLGAAVSVAAHAEDTSGAPEESPSPDVSATAPAPASTPRKSAADLLVDEIGKLGQTEVEILKARAAAIPTPLPPEPAKPRGPTVGWELEHFPEKGRPVEVAPLETPN